MTLLDSPPIVPADHARMLIDPAAYGSESIDRTFAWLRANNPLGVANLPGFSPFRPVTRHADILEISRLNRIFLSAARPGNIMDTASEAATWELTGSPTLALSVVSMDAPAHMKHRLITQNWFMPGNIVKREERLREIARAAVDKMLSFDGRCDFALDVALGYPLHVIMDILGVPEGDEPTMLRLTQELFGIDDPDLKRAAQSGDPALFARRFYAVIKDFDAYFDGIAADRRANPRADVASVIANAQVDGHPIGIDAVRGYYATIATAGHDTTSASTAGAAWALATQPGLFESVKADPSLIPDLVDEAIRWTTPVQHFMRAAAEDYDLNGHAIRKGDWLMLCYRSGNRDEEVFEDPFSFRIDRRPNRHLSFGYGAHLCLGQHLAKTEMRILFEELLPRIGSLELDGEVRRSDALFVRAYKELPIRFRAA